jgi:hypothetical protein
MHAEGQHSRQHAKDDQHRRGGKGMRHALWPCRTVILSLPGCRQRALHGIEQALVADDPGLGLRFAFFAVLTRHEAMPLTEQVPRRLRLFLRRAVFLPLLAISLVTLVAASFLLPDRGQACPAGTSVATHNSTSLGSAVRCQPGPAIKLDTMPMH